MTKEIGDQKTMDVWAVDGANVEPELAKKNVGWLSGERPPFQFVNWFFNLVQKKLNYLFVMGIPEWDEDTAYLEDSIVQLNGTIFRAINANTNDAPPSANWTGLNAKDNVTATTDPTVNDDETDGYSIGSRWYNQTSDEAFLLFDATTGAANWQKTTLTVDELGSAAFQDVGTAIGDVVQLVNKAGNAALPAVDGSNLTGVGTPPTFQYLTASGTYTTPAGCKKIVVEMAGAGGGGGANTTNAGSNGGNTSFNSVTANGGVGGFAGGSYNPGSEGGSGGSGSATERYKGNPGQYSPLYLGGNGGDHPFFGGAGKSGFTSDGSTKSAGEKGGGGAGGATGSNAVPGGGGGGSGEAVRLVISNPASTYSYTIGASGAGGIGNVSPARDGTNGGAGYIRVTEYY